MQMNASVIQTFRGIVHFFSSFARVRALTYHNATFPVVFIYLFRAWLKAFGAQASIAT